MLIYQPLAGSDPNSLYAMKQAKSVSHRAELALIYHPCGKLLSARSKAAFRSINRMEKRLMNTRKNKILSILFRHLSKIFMLMFWNLFGLSIIGNEIFNDTIRDYRPLLGYAMFALLAWFVCEVIHIFMAANRPTDRS